VETTADGAELGVVADGHVGRHEVEPVGAGDGLVVRRQAHLAIGLSAETRNSLLQGLKPVCLARVMNRHPQQAYVCRSRRQPCHGRCSNLRVPDSLRRQR